MSNETGGKNSPTAKRLRQLRAAEGYRVAKTFAEHLGITQTRLSNMEAGHPLSIDVAKKLTAKVPGLSLDWLYFGKEEALPLALRQRLAEFGGQEEKATTTESRSKASG